MICPTCSTEGEVVYSVISHGLICLAPGCAWEQEVDQENAAELLPVFEEVQIAC